MNNTLIKYLKQILLIIITTLFFSSLCQYNVLANASKGIVIDPGHGGYDPGVVLYDLVEKDLCLDIANRVDNYLKWSKYSTIMTRKSDIALHQFSRKGSTLKRKDLNTRVRTINYSGAKLYVSIHVNSSMHTKTQNGTIVYYNPQNKQSKALAENIQTTVNNIILKHYKRNSQKPQPANFYILRNSNIPGVLIETAFITNYTDRMLLRSTTFKNKLAKAISEGIKHFSSKQPIHTNISVFKAPHKLSTSVKKKKLSKTTNALKNNKIVTHGSSKKASAKIYTKEYINISKSKVIKK